MTIQRVDIADLQQTLAVVDAQGRPTPLFLRFLNGAIRSLKNSVNSLVDLENATQAATQAAANANAAAATTKAESSLVNSFVAGFAGASPLEAAAGGAVTVKAHTRQYGDPTLNPNVAAAGGVLATGAAAGAIVRVFYDDPTRADTTPTYQFTVDPAAPPVQGGDRHVIGAVEIPGAGTSDGGYVRNPGFTTAEP